MKVIQSRKEFKTNYVQYKNKGIDTGTRIMTKQSFKDECDINNIMKKYKNTGMLPEMIKTQPQYGDFSEVSDYMESMNIVLKAQEQFQNLSADVRNRFQNDPALFLDFANDPKNGEEMVKMGLATKKEMPQNTTNTHDLNKEVSNKKETKETKAN